MEFLNNFKVYQMHIINELELYKKIPSSNEPNTYFTSVLPVSAEIKLTIVY